MLRNRNVYFNLLGFITIIIMSSFYDYHQVTANQATKGLKLKTEAVRWDGVGQSAELPSLLAFASWKTSQGSECIT